MFSYPYELDYVYQLEVVVKEVVLDARQKCQKCNKVCYVWLNVSTINLEILNQLGYMWLILLRTCAPLVHIYWNLFSIFFNLKYRTLRRHVTTATSELRNWSSRFIEAKVWSFTISFSGFIFNRWLNLRIIIFYSNISSKRLVCSKWKCEICTDYNWNCILNWSTLRVSGAKILNIIYPSFLDRYTLAELNFYTNFRWSSTYKVKNDKKLGDVNLMHGFVRQNLPPLRQCLKCCFNNAILLKLFWMLEWYM